MGLRKERINKNKTQDLRYKMELRIKLKQSIT